MKTQIWKVLALLSPILVLLSACADQHIPLVGSPKVYEEEVTPEMEKQIAALTTDEVADRAYREHQLPKAEDFKEGGDEVYEELVKDWEQLKTELAAMPENERLFRTRTIGRLLSLAHAFDEEGVKSTRTLIVHLGALRYATKLTHEELAKVEDLTRKKIFTSTLTMFQVLAMAAEIYQFNKHPENYSDEQKEKVIQAMRNFDHAVRSGKLE